MKSMSYDEIILVLLLPGTILFLVHFWIKWRESKRRKNSEQRQDRGSVLSEDPYMDQLLKVKIGVDKKISELKAQQTKEMEEYRKTLSEKIKLRKEMRESVRSAGLDKALLSLWTLVTWDDTGTLEEKYHLKVKDLTDIRAVKGKGKAFEFNYDNQCFKLKKVGRSSYTPDSTALEEYSLSVDGDVVLEIQFRNEDSTYTFADDKKEMYAVNIFRKQGEWAKLLIEWHWQIALAIHNHSSTHSQC